MTRDTYLWLRLWVFKLYRLSATDKERQIYSRRQGDTALNKALHAWANFNSINMLFIKNTGAILLLLNFVENGIPTAAEHKRSRLNNEVHWQKEMSFKEGYPLKGKESIKLWDETGPCNCRNTLH